MTSSPDDKVRLKPDTTGDQKVRLKPDTTERAAQDVGTQLPPALPSMWRLCKLGYRHEPRLMLAAFVLALLGALPDALLALWLALLGKGVLEKNAAALRRRAHHPCHLRAQRGRGVRGRLVGLRRPGDPAGVRDPGRACSPCRNGGPRRSARCSGRSWSCGSRSSVCSALRQIVEHPGVLEAVNPWHIVEFFEASATHGPSSRSAASSWSSPAARRSTPTWATSVAGRSCTPGTGSCSPALVLNYFGQAALLIEDPEALENPFYRLAPDWGGHAAGDPGHDGVDHRLAGPHLRGVLADRAGDAGRLPAAPGGGAHVLPPQGQVYVPLVNWALMIGSVGLVLGFQTSSNLAAAYGIAVTTTMAITSILFYVVARDRWGWSRARTTLVVAPLLVVDLAFLAANVPKIPHGGWFPLVVAVVLLDPDGHLAQGPAARRGPHPAGRAHRRSGPRRDRRPGPRGRLRGVPVQGPGEGATGADRTTCATTRSCTSAPSSSPSSPPTPPRCSATSDGRPSSPSDQACGRSS